MQSIAIIGGGLSGTFTAIQLLRQATTPLKVYVIERATEIGHGVAYSTRLDCHLLNVPVSAVSLDPTDPYHFLHWLHQHGKGEITAQDFVPRRWFGGYVQALLAKAILETPHVQFEGIQDKAIHLNQIDLGRPQIQVLLKNHRILTVDQVVLALGNPPPANVPIANPEFYEGDRYFQSGWSGQIEDLLQHPSILFVGAGLTTVDWLVALHERNYSGEIHVLSRHGFLPQYNRLTPTYTNDWLAAGFPKTTLGLLRWVRLEVKKAAVEGYDWRSVIDTLRPHLQTLWVGLPLTEKQRFVRHLRPFWDSHRHRIAPQIGEIVDTLLASGQLHVHTARLQDLRLDGDRVVAEILQRSHSIPETLTASVVVNCTGPQFNYRQLDDDLIQSLLTQKLIRPDSLNLGIDAAINGSVLTDAGIANPQLYTLGPTRRGELWETTAVTEIRDQAIALAQTLLNAKVAAITERATCSST